MAVWRSSELEALLGGLLDSQGLTESALQRLVDQAVRESDTLDFKAKPHLGSPAAPSAPPPPGAVQRGWSAEQELCKDICAFTNARGGLLLIGVEEKDGAAHTLTAFAADPGQCERQMRTALAQYATPIPLTDFVFIATDGPGHLLAIVVPPSRTKPHAVRGNAGQERRPLHYPIRDGADTRWMLEPEIADQYRSRALAAQNQVAGTDQVVTAGLEALGLSQTKQWLYVAVVPEAPTAHRFDLKRSQESRLWWWGYTFASPLGRRLIDDAVITPAPDRVTVTARGYGLDGTEDVAPRRGYAELWTDGRSFAATPVSYNTDGDADNGIVGDITLADDMLLLTDLTLRWAVEQAAPWGTAAVTIGLIGVDIEASVLEPPLTMHTKTEGEALMRVPNSREVRRPVRTEVPIDLSSTTDVPGRLVALHSMLSRLLQHFGIAEPRQLEPDGTIIAWAWGADLASVKRWATPLGAGAHDGNHRGYVQL